MPDIVQQLHDLYRSHPVVMEAADEIERLRRQLAEAREIIERLAARGVNSAIMKRADEWLKAGQS
jgi:PII-like signaling protein